MREGAIERNGKGAKEGGDGERKREGETES